jgi:hypothetical protein
MAFFLVEVTTARLDRITDVFDRGQSTARVGAVLPLEQARTAHEMLGGVPHSRGKSVLNVAGGSSRGGDERVESSVGGIPGCAWRISAGGTESPRRQAMTKVLIALCLAAATAAAQEATVTPLMAQELAVKDSYLTNELTTNVRHLRAGQLQADARCCCGCGRTRPRRLPSDCAHGHTAVVCARPRGGHNAHGAAQRAAALALVAVWRVRWSQA